MPDERSDGPDFADLPPGRQSLWNGLMGLAAIAGLVGVAGIFLPMVPAGIPFVVAAGAWLGARRAAMARFGVWDAIVAGLGVLLVASSFL